MKFGSSNDSEAVKEQYATSKGLDTRITFHDKYSTNKLGYGPWLVSNYEICEGMKVLELGCGTGTLWLGHDDLVARCGKLVLSDLSEGMLEKGREKVERLWGEKLSRYPKPVLEKGDGADLRFEDGSVDIITIAYGIRNFDDRPSSLREIMRVLSPGGALLILEF